MKGRRTKYDFSNHNLNIQTMDCHGLIGKVSIHELRIGNNKMEAIRFINTSGVMTVTGDFGNWVFCREFIPIPEGRVSDIYWQEKLTVRNGATSFVNYSPEKTEALLNELIEEGLEDGYEEDDEYIKYLKDLLDYVEEEFDFIYHAINNKPTEAEFDEGIPICREVPVQLNIVFDAFEEICNRLDKEPIEVKDNKHLNISFDINNLDNIHTDELMFTLQNIRHDAYSPCTTIVDGSIITFDDLFFLPKVVKAGANKKEVERMYNTIITEVDRRAGQIEFNKLKSV
ncbi:hypothetical protein K4L44_05925 [Halosquirtibacter laminarini]|uniref:Uncharacterized protein n=1 Tax=Halosquirtibacter laminarini TaxID=3374600 RepID=A0AC61NI49_9BACT|nr:hypothetical protein K4L44_05925 [Prolixibacteraceae bacterium]